MFDSLPPKPSGQMELPISGSSSARPRARTRARPTRAAVASMASEQGCIGNGCGWCLNCDPIGHALRTHLACELGALTGSSLNWNRSVTPSGRSWFLLATLARRTSGNASGSSDIMPTPVITSNWNPKDMSPTSGDGLGTVLWRMAATPRASDAYAGDRPKRPDGRGPSLPAMLGDMIPTPVGESGRKDRSEPRALQGGSHARAVMNRILPELIPTPTARDRKSDKASSKTLNRNSRPLSEYGLEAGLTGTAELPVWQRRALLLGLVNWLMGLPPGWLRATATSR